MQEKRCEDELFYKFINNQRGSTSSVVTDLTVGEDKAIDSFRRHFQNLASK